MDLKVDLVSDTATRPTDAMKRAMMSAPLGDEQKGEDPTVRAFEERMAALLGTERALFVPSATMGNQIALALHAQAGDEVVCHRTAHVLNHEGAGAAMTARAQLCPLDTPRGIFTVDDVRRVIRADDPHYPRTRCVVVENTSNGGGGSVWPLPTYDAVAENCRVSGLALHLDGARLFHASVALGVPVARLARGATTVQVCFSKGLGCAFGAVLALPSSLWPRARRLKQALGGCLRQAGIAAGGMLYALDHHVERLADDHRRARALAGGLAGIAGLEVEPVETNLVYFSSTRRSPREVVDGALASGVRVAAAGPARLRACLHLDVDDAGVELAVRALERACT
ncbi:MAG: aminotransferase class I/II-fold pyridoxal phosphate-dependent enzyme [Deltaproteobacteria bacterium]|nr:aminotransferase class I/II-fold pyridoxal phosphate-dependent enzyme [Deltaproteobacteria bacterium]